MGFKAEPRGIRRFGERVDELSIAAKSAQTYAEDHLDISAADAQIFATIASAAADAEAVLSRNYERLATIERAAAAEVDKAAAWYQQTDQASAERLDNTY